MVFLWVKCSSMDSSEASLPRPELLDAAIGHVGLHHQVLVDLHEPGLEPLGGVERGLEIAGPDGGGQAVFGVVGLADGVLVILELDDAGHRPEDLLARELVVVGMPVKITGCTK